MTRHYVTVSPAQCLPGMVLVSFHEPLPEITLPGGNPGKLSQTGCAEGELAVFLTGLEAQHGIEIVRPGMARLHNPLTGGSSVQLQAGPL